MALMCQGQVFFESIELAWLLDFRRYFAAEMVQLEALQARGLVAIDTQGVQVTVQGRYCVRSVAMVFDRYLQADRDRAQFSQII
jgi:oxygen-independent coproporphyrinogen-3 oxidase